MTVLADMSTAPGHPRVLRVALVVVAVSVVRLVVVIAEHRQFLPALTPGILVFPPEGAITTAWEGGGSAST